MSAWDRMLLAVGVTYLAFKALTSRRLAFGRALGYWALWPGMDARPFGETAAPAAGPGLMAWGLCKMAAGAALLLSRSGVRALDVVFVFLGIGLLVHFGLCDVLAGFWRSRGVTVDRLFVNPAASRTLAEFWGRRWNRAFHAVAHEFVFRPVLRRWGGGAGVLATFLFSGLLHELLISVPVGAGWGLPTGYFVLHGFLLLAERRWGLGGRAWTLFWILAPLPLLFHPWFVRGIILPLL
jgi:alginate O-acetyltransferase complex protein AlgI